MKYTLENLSPVEFTELVQDLLSAEFGQTYTKMLEGPDAGIDILFYGNNKTPHTVIQCKHYAQSTYSQLVASLRKEVTKVSKIKPKRYIVATSQQLTLRKKREISALFKEGTLAIDDIFAISDLNHLLRRHGNVESAHYKLWLGSTALLTKILHEGTSVWNQHLKSRIENRNTLYVQTPSFNSALKILNNYRIVLIAGPPGVGKTTLADVICAKMIEGGFAFREIIDLEDEIRDLPESGNIVLYFDDFLGHSVWRDNSPGSEKRFTRLIELVQRNNRFWLVLTTRTYLLEDAKKVSTSIETKLDKSKQIMLHVGEMSMSVRAKILYNHLYFNNVSSSLCEAFTDWTKLQYILKHVNFNPRIIESITSKALHSTAELNLADELINVLISPGEIYQSIINDRIGEEARDLLFAIFVSGVPTTISSVYTLWRDMRKKIDGTSSNKELFNRKLKSLDDSLVRISPIDDSKAGTPGELLYFFNPGVRECVRDTLWLHDDRWMLFCKEAHTSSRLARLSRCHPDAALKSSSTAFSVTMPKMWYVQWHRLAGFAHEEENIHQLICDFRESAELRMWDSKEKDVRSFLDVLRSTENESGQEIEWFNVCSLYYSKKLVKILISLPWMEEALTNSIDQHIRDGCSNYDAIDLKNKLEMMGAISRSSVQSLKDLGTQRVNQFLNDFENTEEEIDRNDFDEAEYLNQNLELGLDDEIDFYSGRVAENNSHPGSELPVIDLGDDSLSTAEIQSLFSSLVTQHA